MQYAVSLECTIYAAFLPSWYLGLPVAPSDHLLFSPPGYVEGW